MPSGEFALIQEQFATGWFNGPEVLTGVGDDGALLAPLRVEPGLLTEFSPAVSSTGGVQTQCATHSIPWPPAAMESGAALAEKVLRRPVMALVARGVRPAWMTLALTLPEKDDVWLNSFSAGLSTLARRWQISLVGGDTTRGPAAVTLFVQGPTLRSRAPQADSASAFDRPGEPQWLVGSHRFDPFAALSLVCKGWPAILTGCDWARAAHQFAQDQGMRLTLRASTGAGANATAGASLLVLVNESDALTLGTRWPDAFAIKGDVVGSSAAL
jgi:hypothetical protein